METTTNKELSRKAGLWKREEKNEVEVAQEEEIVFLFCFLSASKTKEKKRPI